MKTIITTNPKTPSGYEITFNDQSFPINEIVDNGKTLKLPENPSNRKYFSIEKIEKAGGNIELTYKESKSISPRNTSSTPKAPSKGLEEYLEGEDKELYLKLIEKANRNKAIAMKKAEIEALTAQLNEMEAQA